MPSEAIYKNNNTSGDNVKTCWEERESRYKHMSKKLAILSQSDYIGSKGQCITRYIK